MSTCVIRIEQDEHSVTGFDMGAHGFDNRWIGRTAFDERYERSQKMLLNRVAVMRANFNVHAHNTSLFQRLAEAGIKDQRATVSNTGFNNHIWLEFKNHFLNAQHILRQLN